MSNYNIFNWSILKTDEEKRAEAELERQKIISSGVLDANPTVSTNVKNNYSDPSIMNVDKYYVGVGGRLHPKETFLSGKGIAITDQNRKMALEGLNWGHNEFTRNKATYDTFLPWVDKPPEYTTNSDNEELLNKYKAMPWTSDIQKKISALTLKNPIQKNILDPNAIGKIYNLSGTGGFSSPQAAKQAAKTAPLNMMNMLHYLMLADTLKTDKPTFATQQTALPGIAIPKSDPYSAYWKRKQGLA